MLFALFVATSQADVEVGDQKNLLFIQLKIATAWDLVQLAENVALQISTSFPHLWNIYGVDDVDHDNDDNDHDLQQDRAMPNKCIWCWSRR